MQFESILRDLVSSVDGAQGAILVDSDGEAVQWHSEADVDRLRLRAAYLAVLVQAARASLSRLGLGGNVSLRIKYEGAWLLAEDLEQGYFMVLELSPASNLGQALSRGRPAARRLRSEIAG